MPLRVLIHAGLTEREAEVYETLLKLGDVSIAEVLRALPGTHPQIVYRALEALDTKGLVTVTIQKHRRFVRAEDPRKLERMEEKRLEELRAGIGELEALRKIPRGVLVRVERGNEALREIRRRGYSAVPSGGAYLALGGSGDRYYEVMAAEHPRLERLRIRRKVRLRLIAFESQRPGLTKDPWKKYAEFRYLPEEYATVSSTYVYADTVNIFIWSVEPVGIVIESPEVAKMYRVHFEALWKVAKA